MADSPLTAIANPLITPTQLQISQDEDGSPLDLQLSLRYHGAKLTQAAGILLKLPQQVIGQAIVILQRFYTGGGGSYRRDPLQDHSAAALYLTAKISFYPQTTRDLLGVYAYLASAGVLHGSNSEPAVQGLSEGEYLAARQTLMESESRILKALAFDTHAVLPHTLALTYLQTLALLPAEATETSRKLVKRVLGHLNSALLSPQLLCLTHQPNALAVAAIYLAAREVGVKVSDEQWWRVWDVDREELGFLVVSFGSLDGFVRRESELWRDRKIPLTSKDVEAEIRRREAT